MHSQCLRLTILASMLALSFAANGQAPDPDATPTVDSIRGPSADAGGHAIQLRTRGGIDAHFDTDLPGDCDGEITRQPVVHLEVSEPVGIRFAARSHSRTRPTLLIHAPDGRWHCDHGNLGRRLPEVQIPRPVAGRYAIWVGAYESPEGDAELIIEPLLVE